jgi:hypothetical protein
MFDEAKQLEQRAGDVWAYAHALIQIGLADKQQANENIAAAGTAPEGSDDC